MDDQRAAKRVRQACLNCRRKKARCSGEKPVCAFCTRLNQRCRWSDDEQENPSSFQPTISSRSDDPSQASLAARVTLLEAKLCLLRDQPLLNPSDILPLTCSSSSTTTARTGSGSPSTNMSGLAYPQPFNHLPDETILLTLIDVYFAHCHNQPYAYFHEATFHRRFKAGAIPDYFLLAFAATACRFSELDYYGDRQAHAIDAYARASWTKILEHSFSYNDSPEIYMVQATNMLAVIDFTAGHPNLGWVKLALAIRFAQGLGLSEEPDYDLPVLEQEERRRTFWSVYVLDRLISLGPDRPPAFSDVDCHVHLPCHEELFVRGMGNASMPTLEAVMERPTDSEHQNLDHFAMTVVMASVTGRVIRSSLKRAPNHNLVPWDPRSAFYRTHSVLLYFESLSVCSSSRLRDNLTQHFTLNSQIDHQRTGHFLLSHALFHLNHILLNHPFILYHQIQRSPSQVPPTFVREALQRCHEHASQMLELLRDATEIGNLVESSFYGYCGMAAGVVHALYARSRDAFTSESSQEKVKMALRFLEREPVRWAHYAHMASLLRLFQPDPETARALIDPLTLSAKEPVTGGMSLWQLLDYARLPKTTSPNWSNHQDQCSSLAKVYQPETVEKPFDTNLVRFPTDSEDSDTLHFVDNLTPSMYVRDVLGEDIGSFWDEVMG